MLNDKDRIFKNLYNDLGADFVSAKKGEIGQILKNFVLKEKSG
jgi:hypothetical protein